MLKIIPKGKSAFYMGMVVYTAIIFIVSFNLGRVQAHYEYVKTTQVKLDEIENQVKAFVKKQDMPIDQKPSGKINQTTGQFQFE